MHPLCEDSGGCSYVTQTITTEPVGQVPIPELIGDPSENPIIAAQAYTPIDNIPYESMTPFVPPVPGTTNVPGLQGMAATQATPMTQEGFSGVASGAPSVSGVPAGSLPSQEDVFANAPSFSVPTNPLLPPGYQEVLNYNNLQYLNGFVRTQIGKYIRVQQLIGSNILEDRYGYLVGVGINYILLQEISTGNIIALDFYNIKYVYVYYTRPTLPTNEMR